MQIVFVPAYAAQLKWIDSLTVPLIYLFYLLGGAKIAYQKLVFSASNYLLSLSSLPDFELVLW